MKPRATPCIGPSLTLAGWCPEPLKLSGTLDPLTQHLHHAGQEARNMS